MTPTNSATADSHRLSRRRVLAGSSAALAALSGCIGDGSDDGVGTDADGVADDNGGDDAEEEPDDFAEEIEEDRQLNGVVLSSSFPIQLFDIQTDERVAEVHYHAEYSHWHFMPFGVPLDRWRPVEARFFDADNEVIPLGPDERFQLRMTRTEDTPESLLELEISQGSLVNIHGTSVGEGELLFHLVEDGENVWTSPPMTVAVDDADEESE